MIHIEPVDCIVIGAGFVGLAAARALALQGREVMVLEREAGIGMGTSSRNSEVIHAGVYYPEGSLKARLCVEGRKALYAYCAERGIAHKACGKLIVATNAAQAAGLPGILDKATRNGVDDMRLLSREEAQALEPALECVAALYSPSTGIVDSHGLMLALQGDLENAGGMVACHTEVVRLQASAEGVLVETADGTRLQAQTVVNAAGLHAVAIAQRTEGLAPEHIPKAYFAKGNYFTLSGRSPFERLIYPAPDPQAHLAGLGIHLTVDLGGQAKFGPDVQWVDGPDDFQADVSRVAEFEAAVRCYWPGLPAGSLQPGYAGIRPKISGPNEPAGDFRIDGPAVHGVAGLVNMLGIESPGLTSSLALGDYVASLISA